MSAQDSDWLLILNASEGLLQIIAAKGDEIVVAEEWHVDNHATEVLAYELKAMCASLGIEVRDFSRIACVNGPGSFTGIRLVLTTALGLSKAGGALLAPINGLQALAVEAFLRKRFQEGERLWVVTHARRNLVHAACFLLQDGFVTPHGNIFLCEPQAILPELSGCFVCGSAIRRYPDIFQGRECEDFPPSPKALFSLAKRASFGREEITPLYIRDCDAHENLGRLASRQGIAAEKAEEEYACFLGREPKSVI